MKQNTIIVLLIMSIIASCKVSSPIQKSYTVSEVQQWYNKDSSANCVLYRGSDAQAHHFLSQFINNWVFLTIKKNELLITDERPYGVDSVAKLGYYYVDPNNHFAKVREY
ncbi:MULTISPECIES: hypothetical protein [Niastella]|uniref:Lipoprotein n=1 Tax=Niastella soli TaxID=2821487 RepID=A0ABS3Z460_9BACT|nr:hypothetical protein [Niastella soli]MBO9204946.1 hypothetical protein [Niastella soli]